ncbi:MAG: tRNA (N6-isopentenyl adenosine(37)-C2)-methylthiotransferase MiaB [Desulfovibrionaceae bacterium]|nr:tRNA (N6-isopentenyl adenosine(37)-C2)-methylthiotransferase MiaB [Desulfovibrionaceae bacterium]
MAPRTYHILTFGCQMNVTDSQWLARALEKRGFSAAPLEEARVAIVNTCSVREKPELKVYSALGRIRHASRNVPGAFAVVAGCVAQQIGSGFFEKFPHVRLVVGGDAIGSAPEAIERLCQEPGLRLNLTDFSASYNERDPAIGPSDTLPPVAFVNIMQGCNNFCAYCIVPYTRGRQKSRSSEAILDECRAVLDRGAKEITLLGQNVNSYGMDNGETSGPSRFAELLCRVAELPGLLRLRFVTPHPKDLSPEVIRLFGELPQLCPRLHLPLQAGSDAVLKRMGRKYDSAAYMRLVEALRKACPDIALSTDLIVGFPGESEEDFRQTLHLVQEAGFMSGFSFCYSDRPGTASAGFDGKIAAEEKLERLERLQAQLEQQAEAWLAGRVGRRTDILLEGASRKGSGASAAESWQGKDPWGDTVNIALPAGHPGDLVRVEISAAKRHSLMGTVL